MFVVISYDIPDDRRRDRVCQTLKDFGTRVQYSVFEAELRPQDLQRLEDRLRRLIDPREDSVRFYFLCRGCVSRIRVMGIGEVTRISSFYWI
ncbi:CRISPR-associated endonuclease Cas2 [Thermoflexus sp.]|jgi:CRISPR-associated protein Cas2|uniref:CRISPR-associated endonuclease Cas2 n=1 Tax=Thermoflexus sp. TaxID=1969742 RepID=UPI001B004B5B|nr:CRISPR-associated endonuclease Cas2 [Thermoflexus sp.]